MHCWALSKVSIKILLCHSFRSAREDTNQSLSLTERSRVSVGILRQHFCEPFLRGGVSATFLPNDAAAAHARVPRRCSRRGRGPPPAGSCSAAPLGTLMHILYQPFQLNPTCIGTACADPSNITFSDRTLGGFGWNSSPSQCCRYCAITKHCFSSSGSNGDIYIVITIFN